MSQQQQKMLFAVCAVAALAILANGQRIDPQRCSQNVQDQINKYTKTASNLVRELVRELASQGNQVAGFDTLQNDADQMISQLSALADTSAGFDVNRIVTAYYEIVQTQMRIGRRLLNPSTGMAMVGQYLSFTNRMLAANSDFLMQVSAQCMPTN